MLKLPSNHTLAKANKIHAVLRGGNHVQRLMEQSIEECSEMIAAIMQFKRGRTNISEVLAEMADVLICIDPILDETSSKKEFARIMKTKAGKYLRQMKRKAK